jgi:hypothetical protein
MACNRDIFTFTLVNHYITNSCKRTVATKYGLTCYMGITRTQTYSDDHIELSAVLPRLPLFFFSFFPDHRLVLPPLLETFSVLYIVPFARFEWTSYFYNLWHRAFTAGNVVHWDESPTASQYAVYFGLCSNVSARFQHDLRGCRSIYSPKAFFCL